MSITPKNWGTFQHYKDRAPSWIKLHRGLLDDYAYSRLPLASKALAPLLWLLASEYEGGTITCSPEEIAFRLRISEKELLAGLNPLIEAGFFTSDSIVLAERKQSACLEKEREKEREEEKRRGDTVDHFKKFKEAYPKRGGSNPWQPAEELFKRAVKSGIDPQQIISAAANYATECDGHKTTGTEKVAQAQTWLRQSRFLDYAPERKTHFTLQPYTDEWRAERARRAEAGMSNALMDAQAEKRRGWSVPYPDIPKEAVE